MKFEKKLNYIQWDLNPRGIFHPNDLKSFAFDHAQPWMFIIKDYDDMIFKFGEVYIL